MAFVPSRWDEGGAKVCGAGGRYRSDECDDQVDTPVYFASYTPKGFRIKASIEWFSRPPPGRLFSYF